MYVCDNCKTEEEALKTKKGYSKPANWLKLYGAIHGMKPYDACSEKCMKELGEGFGAPFVYY